MYHFVKYDSTVTFCYGMFLRSPPAQLETVDLNNTFSDPEAMVNHYTNTRNICVWNNIVTKNCQDFFTGQHYKYSLIMAVLYQSFQTNIQSWSIMFHDDLCVVTSRDKVIDSYDYRQRSQIVYKWEFKWWWLIWFNLQTSVVIYCSFHRHSAPFGWYSRLSMNSNNIQILLAINYTV